MSRRFIAVQEDSWFAAGARLGAMTGPRAAQAVDKDLKCWTVAHLKPVWDRLAEAVRAGCRLAAPRVFEFLEGFDSALKSLSLADPACEPFRSVGAFHVVTMYEMDMLLHHYAFECGRCQRRIFTPPRYTCRCAGELKPLSFCRACACKQTAKTVHCRRCKATDLLETHLLRETARGVAQQTLAGCTGFVLADGGLCGQTNEMCCDTYSYGKQDTVYRLSVGGRTLLVYDVGCILSPIGLSSSGLAMLMFNLYTLDCDYPLPECGSSATVEPRLSAAVLQWALLLGSACSVEDVDAWLSKAIALAKPMTSAALAVALPRGACLVEWSPASHWVSPVRAPAAVRANHCCPESCLAKRDSLPSNVSSRDRETDLRKSIEKADNQFSLQWAAHALSTEELQTDSALATILMEPEAGRLWVRFRLGSRISSTLRRGKWLRCELAADPTEVAEP